MSAAGSGPYDPATLEHFAEACLKEAAAVPLGARHHGDGLHGASQHNALVYCARVARNAADLLRLRDGWSLLDEPGEEG